MKKFNRLLILALAQCISLSAFAEEKFCIAHEQDDIGYASTMNYVINCGSEQFETDRIITSVLLPLPYNWKAVLLKRLNAAMKSQKVVLLAKIPGMYKGNMFEEALLVYGPASTRGSHFCQISQTNQRTVGLNAKTTVWDLEFNCDSNTDTPSSYTGLTESEIVEVITHLGFLNTNLGSLYRKP